MRGLITLAGISLLCMFLILGTASKPSVHSTVITKTIHHSFDEHDDIREYINSKPAYRLTNTITSCYGSGTGFGKAANGGDCATTLVFESR